VHSLTYRMLCCDDPTHLQVVVLEQHPIIRTVQHPIIRRAKQHPRGLERCLSWERLGLA
jgi:hypothetical protein